MQIPLLLLLPFVSFVVTYALTPQLIARLERAEVTGRDLHRKETPKVPQMGGVSVFLGFAVALGFSGLMDLNDRYMFTILLSSCLGTIIGILNDLLSFGKKASVAATLMTGIPVAMFRTGSSVVYSTPLGHLDLGYVFWVLVPFAFAFVVNGVNIYAGFNGLEAGLALVTSFFLGISALLYGSIESALALLILAGSLLAFLRWNFFPAKVFIGDCGTYFIGTVLISAVVVGTIKIVGIIAFTPYLINLVLRARDRFSWTVGGIEEKGRVVSGRLNALWAMFIYRHPLAEKRLVIYCIGLQSIFGMLALIFSYISTYSS